MIAEDDEEAEDDMIDYSDEDMGFGLFDDDASLVAERQREAKLMSEPDCKRAMNGPAKERRKKRIEAKRQAMLDNSNEEVGGAARFLGEDDDEEEEEEVDQGALLQFLIKAQTFEGSWMLGSLPYRAMGIDREAVNTTIRNLGKSSAAPNETVVATALVVIYLEKKMVDEMDTWELVVEKARAWLDDAVSESGLETIWKQVEVLVGSG